MGKEHSLVKGRAVLITLTSTPWGPLLYEDGRRTASYSNFSLLKEAGAGSGRLILGNSADGGHWWLGDILGLAIYNRVISDQEVQQNYLSWVGRDYQGLKASPGLAAFYPFTEGQGEWVRNQAGDAYPLFKPAVFQPLRKVVLAWPTKPYMKSHSFYKDAAVNYFRLYPLGIFRRSSTVPLHPPTGCRFNCFDVDPWMFGQPGYRTGSGLSAGQEFGSQRCSV